METTPGSPSAYALRSRGSALPRPLLLVLGAVAVVVVGLVTWLVVRAVSSSGSAFGSGAGENVEIAPGIVAKSFTAPVDGRGSIVLDGPGPVDIEGDYTYTDEDNWNIDVTGGSGIVGGENLDNQDFTGHVTNVDAEISVDVDVEIPGVHRKGISGWTHRHDLHIDYQEPDRAEAMAPVGGGGGGIVAAGSTSAPATSSSATSSSASSSTSSSTSSTHGFTGTITINAIKGASTLTGTGQMASDGSYEADWTGTLMIGEYPVDLSGHYQSAGWQGQATETWNATGTLEKLTFSDGETVDSGTITASNTSPTFTGTATITYSMGVPMVVTYSVSYTDTNTWSLTANGSQTSDWKPSIAPGLTVSGASFGGAFSSAPDSSGKAVYTYGVRASSTLVIDGVTFSSTTSLTGPSTWSVAVNAGSGQVLGSSQITLDSASGSISYASGAISGTLSAKTTARTTLVLPSGWTHSTTLAISYAKAASDTAAKSSINVTYAATGGSGDSAGITGTYVPGSAYNLAATASLRMNGGTVSLSGSYYSAGSVVNGATITSPSWSLSGSMAGVSLGSGSTIQSGTVTLTSATPGFNGSATIQPFGDSFTFDTSVSYATSQYWTLTATTGSSATKTWTPSGLPNLAIGASSLTGTISMSGGSLAWGIVAPGITWNNIATGVSMTTDFSIGTSCPLTSNCPGTTGMYIGFTNGKLKFSDPALSLTTNGALLSTGAWGRFDASAGTISYDGISVSSTQLTIWKGTRSDTPVANLGMPDLSSSNNGWGMEFCGNFNIGIPDLPTLSTGGCIEWTPSGVVMGQVALGGSIGSPTASGGIKIGSTTLSGFAWTNLTTKPSISLNGVSTPLLPNTNTITGSMAIPGIVMKAITGTSLDTTLPASGWFSASGFDLRASTPVTFKGQGFDVSQIFFEIGKSGHDFTLDFGADGDVTIAGNSWPVDATMAFQAGSTTEISLTLQAKGTRSASPQGTFDAPSLLGAGTFEPEGTAPAIDGSFDNPPASTLAHGDFEDATAPGELLANGGFENGYGANYATNGDFEDGSYGNIAYNADFEENNMLLNGDFEASTYSTGWASQSGSSISSVSDVGPGPADGAKVMRVTNSGSSSTTQTGVGKGVGQSLTLTTHAGVVYTAGAWMRVGSGTMVQAMVAIQADTPASGCLSTTTNASSSTVTLSSTWQYVTVSLTGVDCLTKVSMYAVPVKGGTAIDIDNAVLYATQPTTPVLMDVLNTNDWTASDATKISSAIKSYPARAHGGTSYLEATTTASGGNAYVGLQTTIAPAVGDTYAFSGWLYAPSGALVTATLVTAGGTTETASVSVTVSPGSWKLFQVFLGINNPNHTDLFVRLQVGSVSTVLRADDLQLSKIQYSQFAGSAGAAAASILFDPTVAHGGNGFLRVANLGSTGTVSAYTDVAPDSSVNGGMTGWDVGAHWTVGVWVRAVTGTASFSLWVQFMGGGNESVSKTVTVGTTWQYVSKTITPSQGTATSLRYWLVNNSPGTIVYADDVTVGVINTPFVPDASDAWTAGDSTWTPTYFSTDAHSGSAYLNMWPLSTTVLPSVSKSIAMTPAVGQSYTASAWVDSAWGTYKLTLSAGSDTASATITLTDFGWQQVSVSLPIVHSGATSLQVTLSSVNLSQPSLNIDDVSVKVTGLVQAVPWQPYSATGGGTQVSVLADPAKAHGGSNYLEFKTVGAAGGVSQTVPGILTSGTSQTASVWVKSGTASGASGTVTLRYLDSSGTKLGEQAVGFTAGSTWSRVNVSLTAGSGVALAVVLVGATAAGATVDVDDVTLISNAPWAPTSTGTTTLWGTIDRSSAQDGDGYASFTGSASGSGITASGPVSMSAGSSYRMIAFVRTTPGATGKSSGTLTVTASGLNTAETFTKSFTTSSDWAQVTFDFSPQSAHSTLAESIALTGTGTIDIDSVKVIQTVIAQSDPWAVSSNSSSAPITAVVYDNSLKAHTGDGYLDLTSTTAGGVVSHEVNVAPAKGSSYVGAVAVRSLGTSSATVTICLLYTGGTSESQCHDVSATASGWSVGSVMLTAANSGHTGVTMQVKVPASQHVAVDDASVTAGAWLPLSPTSGTLTQTQVTGDGNAEAGSGYLAISRTSGSGDAGTQLSLPGALSSGTAQAMTVWVKSASGDSIDGRITLAGTGGTTNDKASVSFTASAVWQQVSLTLPIAASGQTGLIAAVLVDTPGEVLMVDTVDIGPDAASEPDGISTALSNPQTGYAYLWDNAWGIPGAHLWAITGQVSFSEGRPGIGLGATTYYDPTQMSSVMTGTAWLKGQLVANISSNDPCFAFGFDGGNTGTAVSIENGLFTSSQFQISIAPQGCSVGQYSVPQGTALTFAATLGTASLDFDLVIGRDDDGAPTFYESIAIANVNLGGIDYNSVTLTTDITKSSSDVTFEGTMSIATGTFGVYYDMSGGSDGIHVGVPADAPVIPGTTTQYNVGVTNWTMDGGGSGAFDVSSFYFAENVVIPFGSDACATMSATTQGNMTMGSKHYDFTGDIEIDCGTLKVLDFNFLYWHGGVSYNAYLSYDSAAGVLSGGYRFHFGRRISWVYLSHRYVRHPQMTIYLAFTMNFNSPSASSLTLGGKISVSGGDGSISCTFSGSGDDSCKLHAHIDPGGGKTWNDYW